MQYKTMHRKTITLLIEIKSMLNYKKMLSMEKN